MSGVRKEDIFSMIARRVLVTDVAVWRERLYKILVLGRLGFVVHEGPFAGMRYVHSVSWGALLPRLVGCYEEELHDVINTLITDEPTIVIDIGCAEGYYAVGLARRLPRAVVYAFDTDPLARALCAKMALQNRVDDRVRIAPGCTPLVLQAVAQPRTAIICDCEGAEVELLDPDLAPVLKCCSILVETHDWIRPGITELIRNRFGNTHDIISIPTTDHDPSRYEVLTGLPEAARFLAVSDQRWAPQEWLWLRHRP